MVCAITGYPLAFAAVFSCESCDIYLHSCAVSFFVRCSETARILLPVKLLIPNLKSPWALSYSNTNFGDIFAEIYTCFERKTAPVMQNFRNLAGKLKHDCAICDYLQLTLTAAFTAGQHYHSACDYIIITITSV